MSEDNRIEQRYARWKTIQSFIRKNFYDKMKEALAKHPLCQKRRIEFIIIANGWAVITKIPVVYYDDGYAEKIDGESVYYIEAAIDIHIDGKPSGIKKMLVFDPINGFHNLDSIVKDCMMMPYVNNAQNEYTITNMEINVPEIAYSKTAAQNVADQLIGLGYSERKALRMASDALAANPQMTDIEQLIDTLLSSKS